MTRSTERVEPSRAVKLCGTDEIDPPNVKLTAGPLTVELDNGQLRYIARIEADNDQAQGRRA